jgi:surfactin synthase thioesterase subunit
VTVELVCFHHAGGGAASFHPLRKQLGSDFAITTVRLPGRESRRDEPRHVDARTCVSALADELDDTLSRPHVLLGHSLGAVLAYGVAQHRISQGLPAPEALIVAANRAPHLRGPADDLEDADDLELATELASYGGLPPEILTRPQWLELLMPTVRDDLTVLASYEYRGEPPLPCPLHIFGGYDDPLASPDELAPWSQHSERPHEVRLFPGGHFLFRQPDPELVCAIRGVVEEAALERNRG